MTVQHLNYLRATQGCIQPTMEGDYIDGKLIIIFQLKL